MSANLFKTKVMLPLVIIGLLLLGLAGRGRVLVVLLVVPVYYLCVQSALSTEYRYILALHYCLFIASAVALYGAGITIGHLTSRLSAKIRERRGKPTSDAAERSAKPL